MNKRRVRMYIDEDIWERVRRYARERRMTLGDAVMDLIAPQMAQDEVQASAAGADTAGSNEAMEELLGANLGPMGTPEELREEILRAHLPCGFEDIPLPEESEEDHAQEAS